MSEERFIALAPLDPTFWIDPRVSGQHDFSDVLQLKRAEEPFRADDPLLEELAPRVRRRAATTRWAWFCSGELDHFPFGHAIDQVQLGSLSLWLARPCKPSVLGIATSHKHREDDPALLTNSDGFTFHDEAGDPLTEDEIDRARFLYSRMAPLSMRRTSVLLALRACWVSVTQKYRDLGALLFWIALESLFGSLEGARSPRPSPRGSPRFSSWITGKSVRRIAAGRTRPMGSGAGPLRRRPPTTERSSRPGSAVHSLGFY